MDKRTVWVVDDDSSLRSYLYDLLSSRGHAVVCLSSGEQLVRRISSTGSTPPTLLMLDVRLPRMGGLEVLTELDRQGLHVPVIVLSGMDDVSTAVQAMRLGASDYLVKPLDPKDLDAALERVWDRRSSPMEPESPAHEAAFQTSNPRMLHVKGICDRAAEADVPVLILGESGVGKEVVAHYLHARSGRGSTFVKVNCAALPTDLLESELFGHERGAFTGAQNEKPGKFEQAGKGSIMLDEIAEMSPLLQAKLLHILQDGEYSRLGGTHMLRSEARIIAATNRRLETMVTSGGFREDLMFRLNVITVEIPPLRERAEDIPALANRFVEMYRAKYKSDVERLPPELTDAFVRYHWPGNIRQLENHVRRFLILPDLRQALRELESSTIFAETPPATQTNVSLKELAATAAEGAEKELILRTLNDVNWNRKEAARRLDICYKSLLNKLHRWELGSQVNGRGRARTGPAEEPVEYSSAMTNES